MLTTDGLQDKIEVLNVQELYADALNPVSYTHLDVYKRQEHMCVVKKGPNHGTAPIPEEGKWVKSKEIVDISGLTHGIGSVSCTHLDVYKRQPLQAWRRARGSSPG